jgi:hypothetical protein
MRALVPSGARARWRSHRATPLLECLEPRALLSRTGPPILAALPATHVQRTVHTQADLMSQQSPHQHPLNRTIENRRVEKPPIFYAPYAGPIRPDLAAVSATGQYARGKGLLFTGYVLGAINSSQSSFYVFGVNRGGASPPGPFPDRPMIDFDAEIIVSTSSDGFEGEVELLNGKGQPVSTTSLTNVAVVFSKNRVYVFVPRRDLPSTSPPGTAETQNDYSYAFWAGISPSAPKGIASFFPQYADASVLATGFRSS